MTVKVTWNGERENMHYYCCCLGFCTTWNVSRKEAKRKIPQTCGILRHWHATGAKRKLAWNSVANLTTIHAKSGNFSIRRSHFFIFQNVKSSDFTRVIGDFSGFWFAVDLCRKFSENCTLFSPVTVYFLRYSLFNIRITGDGDRPELTSATALNSSLKSARLLYK